VHGTALETRGEVTATAYDTSGTRMVTTTADGAIHVWDRADGPDGAPGHWRQSAAWAAHDAPCAAVAFAPAEHGRCLASSDVDGVVRVWREPPRAPTPAAAAAALAAAEDGSAVWEPAARLVDAPVAVRHLAFAPPEHGLQLATGADDGVVRFYSPTDPLALAGWELCNEAEALSPGAACTAVCWRRPGPLDDVGGGAVPAAIAVGLTWPNRGGKSDARVLAYDEGGMRWRVASTLFEGPTATTALAWAPDADAGPDRIETVAAAMGSEVGVFRVEGFGARWEGVPGDEGPGTGTGTGTGTGSSPGTARSSFAATLAHPATVHGVDWNAAGSALATSAGDGRVRVWVANVQTGVWEERAQLVGE
jgi:WD40 repeat protein